MLGVIFDLTCVQKNLCMSPVSVAFFCMPEVGHFQRLQSLISGLSTKHIVVNVFTHRMFEPKVKRAGGVFFDLFSKYPLENVDNTSFPIPCRFVSFAATYAGQICRDVEKTMPSLVIHDTFAVIGQVVATLLGIPRINICAGHNLNPDDFLPLLKKDPRVKLSARCLLAVKELRDHYGIADASPFSCQFVKHSLQILPDFPKERFLPTLGNKYHMILTIVFRMC